MRMRFFFLWAVVLVMLLTVGSAAAAPMVYRFEGSIATLSDGAGAAAGISQNDPIVYEFLIDYDVDGQSVEYDSSVPGGFATYTNPDNPYVELLSGNPIIEEVGGGQETGADGDIYAWNFGVDVLDGYAYFQTGNRDEYVLIQSGQTNYAIADWQIDDRFEFYAYAYDNLGNLTAMTDPDIRLADVSAVPVPAAVWLLGSGLLGILGVRRKMKK